MPSPVSYDKDSNFSPRQTHNSFSFGLGRDNMKKLYIQEIEKKGEDKLPSPDTYNLPKTFGAKGIHFSMREALSRKESKVK